MEKEGGEKKEKCIKWLSAFYSLIDPLYMSHGYKVDTSIIYQVINTSLAEVRSEPEIPGTLIIVGSPRPFRPISEAERPEKPSVNIEMQII